MRLLMIAAACLLAAAGSAAAQTKGFAPYSAPIGSPTVTQTNPGASTTPSMTTRPAAMAGGSSRPTMTRPAMGHAMTHRGIRHAGMRHHGMRHRGMSRHDATRGHHRSHSAGFCGARAKAHGRTGRGATHAIQRCEAGRPHHHHGRKHHGRHHAMAHANRHAAAKPKSKR